MQDTVFCEKIEQLFNSSSKPCVMGILNITPDSFYDGGKYLMEGDWLGQTAQMITEGATLIDVGACSSKPGAADISEEDELERLIKVIKSIRKHFPEVLISVDTFRAKVAQKAVEEGANIINDISGGTMDAAMYATVAKLNVPYILMHIQGTPKTMQQQPIYTNVVNEVYAFFENKLRELTQMGVSKIIIDPGFGFGKTLEHNYSLLKQLNKFTALGVPILVGISRKSMVYKLLDTSPDNALNGTTVVNTIAIQNGAKILRVHDVKAANEVIKIADYILKC